MDSEILYPSIEHDDLLDDLPAAGSTKNQTRQQNALERLSLGAAASTPLPPSSPLKSPRKTPRIQRQTSSLGSPASETPSYQSARSSPFNNDRRSATPNLNMKRSNSNLAANAGREMTPSRQQGMRRVSSTQLKTVSPSTTMKHSPDTEKKPMVTAGSVARDYFTKELAHLSSTSQESQTTIFVHDSCYGHRFSRPRTSRAALSTIVERPERILATLLGVSAAYVRLGERHSEGKYGPSPNRDPSNTAPPFTIRKTSRFVALSYPAVTDVHGAKWMEELQIMCDSAEGKLALNGKELTRPIGYGKDENGIALPKLHEGDLYLCAESLDALQGCLGGVCDAVDAVFSPDKTTRAFVCIRPPGHHCSSDFPSGFCWLNNVHVGISHAAMTHGLTHAAIIDFDLHHGDGSQTITWDHNRRAQTLQKNAAAHKKTPIGYFSLHDINSYPCEMGDEDKVRNASLCIENAHGQSIWNVHLEPWRNLEEFWKLYETRYSALLEKTRLFLQYHTSNLNSASNGPRAKAAIFLSAGFDASEWEGAGMQRHKVNVPTDFYARFTADVVRLSEEEGLGVDGRVVSVLEGGYSDRALTSGVLSHVTGLAQAQVLKSPSTRMKVESLNPDYNIDESIDTPGDQIFNTEWWAAHNLELLELKVNPDMILPAKKSKEKQPGDYSAPTEASTAKMTDTARERRSISAQFGQRLNLEPEPVQPPPEVDWATAAYELSKLIIPSDRQTLSCRHEDLNAGATRARKERQSLMTLPVAEEPRELRARKAKPVPFEVAPARARSKSREAKRRTTVASVADLPDPEMVQTNGEAAQPTSRPRRRSSAASSMMAGFESMQINDRLSAQPSQAGSDPTSSRATSVATGKLPKAPVIKKPRAIGNAKGPAKPRSSPKKTGPTAPPVPRVPSAFHGGPGGDVAMAEFTTGEQHSSQVNSRTGGSLVKADDIDTLSGGMQKLKIKLKVTSPEEHAAREEEKALLPKPKAARKPLVPKPAKVPKTIAASRTKTPTERSQQLEARDGAFYIMHPQTEGNAPVQAGPPAGESAAEVQDNDLMATSPHLEAALPSTLTPEEHTRQRTTASPTWEMVEQAGQQTMSPPTWAPEKQAGQQTTVPPTLAPFTADEGRQNAAYWSPTNSEMTALQASTQDTSSEGTAVPEDHSIRLMPVQLVPDENVLPSSTTSPSTPFGAVKRTKADLPNFTSSSPIPFSKGAGNDEAIQRPRTANDLRVNRLLNDSLEEQTLKQDEQSTRAEPSIWDIPETPQQHH